MEQVENEVEGIAGGVERDKLGIELVAVVEFVTKGVGEELELVAVVESVKKRVGDKLVNEGFELVAVVESIEKGVELS